VFPVLSSNPALAEPVSFGAVALDANSIGLSSSSASGKLLNIQIGLNAFAAPVDIYIAAYVSGTYYLLRPDNSFQTLETGLVKWKGNQANAIDESLFGDISTASLPSGTYNLYLFATPAGSIDNYYGWQTWFVIP
jgi:hypothetical protein